MATGNVVSPTRTRNNRTSAPSLRPGADHPMWFLLPALAVLVVFFFTPTLYNFIYAFTDWSSFKSAINNVGLSNFADLLQSGSLLADLRITLIYAVLVA